MNDEAQHFNKLFWFCVCLTAIAVIYDFCLTYINVPQANQKYADILIGSLNTGALMSGVQFLLGGNALPKKNPTVTNADTVNVDQSNK